MQDGDDDDGPDTEDPNGPDETEPPDSIGAQGVGKRGGAGRPDGDGKDSGDAVEWENTEGLPKVTVSKASGVYVSKDIADKPGESAFNPTLGCKCGIWESAPSHPTIDFRKSFLADHEDFRRKVRKLKVHMEDTTTPKPVVHWDAAYDLKRFLGPDKMADLRLPEALPAIPHSGTQLNFLTFCPPEGRGSHQYRLTVTALDEQDNPISYFSNETSTYQAAPPAPEAKVQLPFAAKSSAQKGPPAKGLLEVARATLK